MNRSWSSHTNAGRKAGLRSRLLPERGGFSLADGLLRSERDFTCAHCGIIVSADPLLSGVGNRNHCPYCLWSKHLDLHTPGDRLAACKRPMQPLALTRKRTRNKYARENRGELMLVHMCTGCGKVSLNRIAADDHPRSLLEIFERSLTLGSDMLHSLERAGVHLLRAADAPEIAQQLMA